MVAAKFCDLYRLIRNHVNENDDATQAYTQSTLGRTKTWVSLPREEWPESWKHTRRPARRLDKALYGHPDAGDTGNNIAITISKIGDLTQHHLKIARGAAAIAVRD
jgi:hypothetical protein